MNWLAVIWYPLSIEADQVNSTPVEELVSQLNSALSITHGAFSPEVLLIISRLCQAFAESSPEGRARASGLDRAAHDALLGYASYAARESVRKNSPGLAVEGLTALLVEDGYMDIRDTLKHLAMLLHSARLLNMDADKVFTEAASLSRNTALADRVRTFPKLPWSGDLLSFFVCARGSGPEFRYEPYDPPLRKWWQFWRS